MSNRLRTNIRQQLMKEKSLIDEQRNKQEHITANDNNVQLWLKKDYELYSPIKKPEEEDSAFDLFTTGSETSLSEVDSFFEDINEIFKGEISLSSKNILAASLFEQGVAPHQLTFPPISASCPDELGNGRIKSNDKRMTTLNLESRDAYKKAKHNFVEKKRRYKIDDCIKELGELLPPSFDIDLNNKKGYILEKSVEYMLKLKKDEERCKEMEARQKELEKINRKLLLQIQTLQHSVLTQHNKFEVSSSVPFSSINLFTPQLPPNSHSANQPAVHDPAYRFPINREIALPKESLSTDTDQSHEDEFANLVRGDNCAMDTLVWLPDESYEMPFAENDVPIMRSEFGNNEEERERENMLVSHEEEVYSGN